MLSVVVLPQPEGPSSTMNSLSRISRSSRSTAVTLPYRLVNWRQAILAMHYPLTAPAVRPETM